MRPPTISCAVVKNVFIFIFMSVQLIRIGIIKPVNIKTNSVIYEVFYFNIKCECNLKVKIQLYIIY